MGEKRKHFKMSDLKGEKKDRRVNRYRGKRGRKLKMGNWKKIEMITKHVKSKTSFS